MVSLTFFNHYNVRCIGCFARYRESGWNNIREKCIREGEGWGRGCGSIRWQVESAFESQAFNCTRLSILLPLYLFPSQKWSCTRYTRRPSNFHPPSPLPPQSLLHFRYIYTFRRCFSSSYFITFVLRSFVCEL